MFRCDVVYHIFDGDVFIDEYHRKRESERKHDPDYEEGASGSPSELPTLGTAHSSVSIYSYHEKNESRKDREKGKTSDAKFTEKFGKFKKRVCQEQYTSRYKKECRY